MQLPLEPRYRRKEHITTTIHYNLRGPTSKDFLPRITLWTFSRLSKAVFRAFGDPAERDFFRSDRQAQSISAGATQ